MSDVVSELLEQSTLEHQALDREVRVTNPITGGQKGAKLARFDLLPAKALWKVAELYGRGAAKYAPWNYRLGYAWSLSIAALERHLALWKEGEETDAETQCHHLASVVFHALALLLFTDEHPELDDRWKPEGNDGDQAGGAQPTDGDSRKHGRNDDAGIV